MDFFEARYGDETNARPQRQDRQVLNGKLDQDEITTRKYEVEHFDNRVKGKKIRPREAKMKNVNDTVFSINSDEVVMRRERYMPLIQEDVEQNWYKDDQDMTLDNKHIKVLSSANGLTWEHPDNLTEDEFYELPIDEQRFWVRRGWIPGGISDTPNNRGDEGLHETQGLSMLAVSIQGIKQLCQNDEFIAAGDVVVTNAPRVDGAYKRPWKTHGIDPNKVQWPIQPLRPENIVTWESFSYHLRFLIRMMEPLAPAGADRIAAFSRFTHDIQGDVGYANPAIAKPQEFPPAINDALKNLIVYDVAGGGELPARHLPLLCKEINVDVLAARLYALYGENGNINRNYDAAKDLVKALQRPELYYHPSKFAGHWLRSRLYSMLDVLSAFRGSSNERFAQWIDISEQFVQLGRQFTNPIFVKATQVELQLYFQAYQEVHKRIIGRALTSNGVGRKVILQSGKGPI